MRRLAGVILVVFLVLKLFSIRSSVSAQTTPEVLRTAHKGLLLESDYTKRGCCTYTITNKVSIANRRLDGIEVRWLSAALTTGELFAPKSPAQPCVLEYPLQLLWMGPVEYDAADLWGNDHSVIARLKGSPDEKFNAPAYAPPGRIVKEVLKDVLRALPLKRSLSLTSEIRVGDMGVVFISQIRRTSSSEDKFEYNYVVLNRTKVPVTFRWTSVMNPEFRRSNGPISTIQPGGKYEVGPFAGGLAGYVNDVALLSRSNDLTGVEFLGDWGTYGDRLVGASETKASSLGLRGLPIGTTVILAPALNAYEWIREGAPE